MRTDDILLMGMHGAQIADDEKMFEFLSHPLIFGSVFSDDVIVYIRELVQTTIVGGVADFGLFFSFPFLRPVRY